MVIGFINAIFCVFLKAIEPESMNYLQFKHVVFLTGAGISAESGIATYRDKKGLWTQNELQNLAKPAAFAKSPETVHDFYNQRRIDLKQAQPNKAHFHIAHLQKELTGSPVKLTIITQNVDDLHEKAGTKNVIHIHGELNKALCTACDKRSISPAQLSTNSQCVHCGKIGCLRPDIVWFGEVPYKLDYVQSTLEDCDLFVSIGTSGSVFPASDFVQVAKQNGAYAIELNLEAADNASKFDEGHYGVATEIVPAWIDKFVYN